MIINIDRRVVRDPKISVCLLKAFEEFLLFIGVIEDLAPTELTDRRFEGRVRLGKGLVEFGKRGKNLTRERGRCGEGCEGERECDKGCKAHDDDDEWVVKRVVKDWGKRIMSFKG